METRREIEDGLTQHFSKIFSEDGGDKGRDIERITSLIPRAVNRENNKMLTKPVAMQEVEEVGKLLAQMASPLIFSTTSGTLSKGRFLRSLKNLEEKGEFSRLSMQPS